MCFFVFDCIPDQYKTQEMCNSIICEDSFSTRYVPDQYKTQQMCGKSVYALKFLPNWFFTSNTIKTLFTAL